MTANNLLEPFCRNLTEDQEPDYHQQMFLYLPLSILRNFTNIESIIADDYTKNKAKQPTKREIEQTIAKYHQQMVQLNKWKKWGLDKLEFRLTHSKYKR